MARVSVLNTKAIQGILSAAQEASASATTAAAAARAAAITAEQAANDAATRPGLPGDQGAPGPTLNPRGEYQPNTTYFEFDSVTRQGSSYWLTVDEIADEPPPGESWALSAQAGQGLSVIEGISERVLQQKLSGSAQVDLSKATNFDLEVDRQAPLSFANFGEGETSQWTVGFMFKAGLNFVPDVLVDEWRTPNGEPPNWSVGQDKMDLIGFFTRRGRVYARPFEMGLELQKRIALVGSVIQYLFDEGSGVPQDSSGSGNHLAFFDGTYLGGGGVAFGSAQHGRTATLAGITPSEAWWVFYVLRGVDTQTLGVHGGLASPGANQDYILFRTATDNPKRLNVVVRNTDSQFNATSNTLSELSREDQELPYRAAIAQAFDPISKRLWTYVLNAGAEDRRGYTLTPAGPRWVGDKMFACLGGVWRATLNGGQGALLGGVGDYDFYQLRKGFPADSELSGAYAFAKTVCAGRPGANLP